MVGRRESQLDYDSSETLQSVFWGRLGIVRSKFAGTEVRRHDAIFLPWIVRLADAIQMPSYLTLLAVR